MDTVKIMQCNDSDTSHCFILYIEQQSLFVHRIRPNSHRWTVITRISCLRYNIDQQCLEDHEPESIPGPPGVWRCAVYQRHGFMAAWHWQKFWSWFAFTV